LLASSFSFSLLRFGSQVPKGSVLCQRQQLTLQSGAMTHAAAFGGSGKGENLGRSSNEPGKKTLSQDASSGFCHIFSRGSQAKPSFATVTGGTTQIILVVVDSGCLCHGF